VSAATPKHPHPDPLPGRERERTVQVLADLPAVARAAAERFVALARDAAAARGRFTVALSGGSTPRALFQLLAGEPFRSSVPWDRVELFWGDERCVPPSHPDSNYAMVRTALLSRVRVPAENVHRIPAERPPPEAARAYEETLRRAFALRAGEWPRFDLLLLGLGADGHTASLFPESPGLRADDDRLVIAHYVEQLQSWRISLTARVFNHAAFVVFLVCGADKAASLRKVLRASTDPQQLPAQLIRPRLGTLLWLTDREAAALLDEPGG